MILLINSFNWLPILLLLLLILPVALYFYNHFTGKNEIYRMDIAPKEHRLGFDDLAPVDDAEHSKVYLETLYWALTNNKVKNIAITGPYGSGKSSILQTFKNDYQSEFRYLNISLASFKEEINDRATGDNQNGNSGPREEQKKNEASQLIELSILQQIFYKVDEAQIPDSRFKRITAVSDEKLQMIITVGILSALALICLVLPGVAERISFIKTFSFMHPDAWILLPGIFLLPGFIWALYYFTGLMRGSGVKKLKISSGEIEIDPRSEGSILNKYLDELIYFFEVTGYNVVFIEDLDRFDDPEIFTKLRELNLLLNSSSQVKNRVIFVYAVKDDLFPDERTRTKFFDFIIPVIPVINWSNSLKKLTDKLDSAGMKIETRFITSITLYIDDMRVLKNIFNELMLYQESLKIPPDRQSKLLAMIVYKNIYPDDFAKLHDGEGIVANIFAQIAGLKGEAIKQIDSEINALRETAQLLEKQMPLNIKELRAAYIQAIIDELEDFQYLMVDGRETAYNMLQSDHYFQKLIKKEGISYYKRGTGQRAAAYNFQRVEKEVYQALSYAEREIIVKQKSETHATETNNKLLELEQRKISTAAAGATEMINLEIDRFAKLSLENKNYRLLRYLLIEGFIDLTYPYLISYFYPSVIGLADMHFFTYVNDRILLPMDYELEKPAGLIDMLDEHDFDRDSILNVHIMRGLLEASDLQSEKLTRMIRQLANESQRSRDFIVLFVETGTHVNNFARLLCKQWPGMMLYQFKNGDENTRRWYARLIWLYADLEDIDNQNKSHFLTKYINKGFVEIP